MLQDRGVPAEHIAAVAAQEHLPRYRPEEVAGAAAADSTPAAFELAELLASQILVKLKADGLVKPPSE